MNRPLILALALAATCHAVPVTAQDGPDLSTRLATTLDEFRDRYGFPGATAAIMLPDGTVVTAAAGLADLENGRVMSPGTLMLAASVGKTFVAATVLALESEGTLSRADLLSAHLGDRPWFAELAIQAVR